MPLALGYVARMLELPEHCAGAAFDAVSLARSDWGGWTVEVPGGRLVLGASAGGRPLTALGRLGIRKASGWLLCDHTGQRVRVELELGTWSPAESELGLVAVPASGIVGGSFSRPQRRLAGQLLDALADLMEDGGRVAVRESCTADAVVLHRLRQGLREA